MVNVVFVGPSYEYTRRFVEAVASLPGVRLGLVSQDEESRLPQGARDRLFSHYQVEDVVASHSLRLAILAMQQRLGSIDRLLGTIELLQGPLGALRDELGIRGMSARRVRNFRDKARMKDLLVKAGLPCARYRLIDDPAQGLAFAREVGFPLIAKPPAGVRSESTFRLDHEHALGDCMMLLAASRERPLLLEEHIAGEEHSFDSAVVDGRVVWHSIVDYHPGPLEVLQRPSIQWTVLSPRDIGEARYAPVGEVAARALSVLGMENGLSHLEWFRRADGSVAISEVAARPPGAQFLTIHSYAHDFDFYRAWAALMVHDVWEQPPERRYAVGAAYLRGGGTGRRVSAILGIDDMHRELGELVVEARLPKRGEERSSSYEGQGYVILRHPRTETVKAALKQLVALLRVEMS